MADEKDKIISNLREQITSLEYTVQSHVRRAERARFLLKKMDLQLEEVKRLFAVTKERTDG